MSIQAVAWVLGQRGEDLPGTARLVLISLANHADHTTGHCWPSVALIAQEAGCSERSASRYIYALSRNGFIDVRRTHRKDGQFRSNDFWILFDRKPAAWQYFNRDGFGEEPQDIEPHANLADGETAHNGLAQGVEDPADSPQLADGPSATVGATHKMLEPSDSQPSPTEQVEGPRAKPSPPASSPPPALAQAQRPKAFDEGSREREIASLKAAERASKPQRYPVIEGSEPWKYHVAAGHPPGLATWIEHKGKRYRGWYFAELYPRSQSPPALTSDDRTAPVKSPETDSSRIENLDALADELGR